ncbi:MAG: FtsH protease activity modulator HflK [bacterium]|nr:FtsH protease activity modulator HflK [bacterium]
MAEDMYEAGGTGGGGRKNSNFFKKLLYAASGSVVGIVVLVFVVMSALNGFYTLTEDEQAVVTTFGKPEVVSTSGLHFKIPYIQKVKKVTKSIIGMPIGYTQQENYASDPYYWEEDVSIPQESLMITQDFNFVNVDFYIEYQVTDPIKAVQHASSYQSIIKNLAQSYIRDTVGVYKVDDVITTGKTEIQGIVKEKLRNRLEQEDIGYGIYNVTIQDSELPTEEVSNAFKSVEDAKQGMETALNNANKYKSEQIPKANAQADKILQEAEAYKQQRINEANGQVARFESMYAEYAKYPLITKKRMFYETMEEILPDLKVIIDSGDGTQKLLPLESFQSAGSESGTVQGTGLSQSSSQNRSTEGDTVAASPERSESSEEVSERQEEEEWE